jgi:hypothetical protein
MKEEEARERENDGPGRSWRQLVAVREATREISFRPQPSQAKALAKRACDGAMLCTLKQPLPPQGVWSSLLGSLFD